MNTEHIGLIDIMAITAKSKNITGNSGHLELAAILKMFLCHKRNKESCPCVNRQKTCHSVFIGMNEYSVDFHNANIQNTVLIDCANYVTGSYVKWRPSWI